MNINHQIFFKLYFLELPFKALIPSGASFQLRITYTIFQHNLFAMISQDITIKGNNNKVITTYPASYEIEIKFLKQQNELLVTQNKMLYSLMDEIIKISMPKRRGKKPG